MTKIITKKHFKELSQDEKQMNVIISRIRTAKENVAKNILELGKQLYLAKQLVAHGDWEKWLIEKVDFSVRTAQTYIKTYKIIIDLPEKLDATFIKLDSSKLIEIATIKKHDIEKFITSTHEINGIEKTIEEMSVRELKEVIKENKKSKKKFKQDKNADICVNENQEDVLTEEQKLAQIIKEQQELEQQLMLKQKQAKETKENILKNKKILDLKIEFEETIEDGSFCDKTLSYNIYLIRANSVKELVLKEVHYSLFENIDITNEHDNIAYWILRNKNLMQEEKNFILGQCLKFKNTAIKRGTEIYEEDFMQYYDNLHKINNELNKRKQEPQEITDLKKEFIIAGYKALAKKYHPDINNNSEAEDKFKAISVLKDMFLQQNLLN
ncbi:DUF3102 domain-containing protein [Clostridium botulinum]|nr:DUF3102 domain-containing protein [Clostridium botulinum]